MRAGVLVLTLILMLAVGMCGRSQRSALSVTPSMLATSPLASTNATKPDFDKEIKPILQSRCMPCHFQGGKVYDKMPFDKPETITKLGEKMCTRHQGRERATLFDEWSSKTCGTDLLDVI